jgi:6-phosphogluconolactonase
VGDPASNYGQALRLLAKSDILIRARVHPMVTSRVARLADAAASYGRVLEDILGRPPVIDVALLGVGEDGHVASIFPGSRALAEREAWTVAVGDAPKPPPRRLTLTMPVLECARVICIGAFGLEKAHPMHEALNNPVADTPVARLLRDAQDAWVLVDPPAASLLDS